MVGWFNEAYRFSRYPTITNTHRELFGIIGLLERTSEELVYWNSLFREKGIDASMDHYPTTVDQLPQRLSEMFTFDRRAYIVGDALQESVSPLLDSLDLSATKHQKVSLIINSQGILQGYYAPSCREKLGSIVY